MSGVKCGQSVVRTGLIGLGWDYDRILGGGTEGGGGRYVQNVDGYGLNRWEDTVVNLILGAEPNATLASELGL